MDSSINKELFEVYFIDHSAVSPAILKPPSVHHRTEEMSYHVDDVKSQGSQME